MSEIMNKKQILEYVERFIDDNGVDWFIERMSIDRSSPASGSRTREAGRKPDATTDHTTAPPFPDQATGEQTGRTDLEAYHAWFQSVEGDKVCDKLGFLSGTRHWFAIVEVFYAGRASQRSEPRAQSEAGEDEVCPICKGKEWVPSKTDADTDPCPCVLGTLSRRERSGSGNDQE